MDSKSSIIVYMGFGVTLKFPDSQVWQLEILIDVFIGWLGPDLLSPAWLPFSAVFISLLAVQVPAVVQLLHHRPEMQSACGVALFGRGTHPHTRVPFSSGLLAVDDDHDGQVVDAQQGKEQPQ